MPLIKSKEERKESKAFKKIVARRALQARRKAFADESLVQAKKKGKELAVSKSTKGKFGEQVRKGGRVLLKKVLTPPPKSSRKRPARRVMKKVPLTDPFANQQVPMGF